MLKFGSLPVALEVGQITSITPTVGTDYLQAGLLAGAHRPGARRASTCCSTTGRSASSPRCSLVIAAIITYCLFVVLGRTVGFTLTLAGVAGAIVAIGITADSFIVYFERIRDEIRDGRTLRVAAETGWLRARRTLLAADFVSLLGAVVLYLLSIGSVRGFAFALGLTTVVDVLVAFVFTRPVVAVLAATRFFQSGHPLSGVAPERLGLPPAAGSKKAPAAAALGHRWRAWMSSSRTRRSMVPLPGPVWSRDRVWASYGLAALTRGASRALRRGSEDPRSVRATARLCGTAGAGPRSATPSRGAVAANFGPISGTVYWLCRLLHVGQQLRPLARQRQAAPEHGHGSRASWQERQTLAGAGPRGGARPSWGRRSGRLWPAAVEACRRAHGRGQQASLRGHTGRRARTR